jgi:hypothetical protein
VQTGDRDRKRLPQPVDRVKGNLVFTQPYSVKDIEIERAANQQKEAYAPHPAQLVVHGNQVVSSE